MTSTTMVAIRACLRPRCCGDDGEEPPVGPSGAIRVYPPLDCRGVPLAAGMAGAVPPAAATARGEACHGRCEDAGSQDQNGIRCGLAAHACIPLVPAPF